ncbi:rifin [Plasmodium falciparum IGH-CR14]|uniref:Rifin n=1 Tax=Plasmodium falciparum IGH-CR14 TaxID=580059 RepID=A0A0L1IG79_PLAFA|nr:rifin [Plasmodium falciparum IGH-CR14]
MKFYYINILLFALPLNILVNIHVNHYITFHTKKRTKIPNTRLLCECDMYTSIYDNDPEMKALMGNYCRQISQRFKEYDECMIKSRQKGKEECDKEIQKIILKDKIEKELEEQFSALETKIYNNDISTCVCKKSLADKMEKKCLKCTQYLGGVVSPSSVVLGGIGQLGLNVWKDAKIAAAIVAAEKAGEAAGKIAGDAVGATKVLEGLKALDVHVLCPEISESFFHKTHYTNVLKITNVIFDQREATCSSTIFSTGNDTICSNIAKNFNLIAETGQAPVLPKVAIAEKLNGIVEEAKIAAGVKATQVATSKTAILETAKKGAIQTTYIGYQNTIIASIVAILVIVLVMVIIYLILRYRRKNKMKKKLQYIKLLKE